MASELHPRQMETAPRDGTVLRLLVRFEEHALEDTAEPCWTIGHNGFDHNGEDEWHLAGWCWCHDHFTAGKGTPVGWLPFHADAPPQDGKDTRRLDALVGPITLEAKVHVINDETGQIGSANVGFAPGKPVTLEDLHWAVGQTLEALPAGFRVMSGEEFFNQVLVREKTGRVGRFAVPSSFCYDTDALTAAARDAFARRQEQRPAAQEGEGTGREFEDDDDDEI